MSDAAPERQLQLRGAYARAIGLKNAAPTSGSVPGLANDLNEIVHLLLPIIGPSASAFAIRPPDCWGGGRGDRVFCDAAVLQGRLGQLVSYLEHVYNVSENIIELGSLYNSIKDPELKSRCSDLLSAPGNFDRVINQATLVLEDRLRAKSGIDKPLTGVPLVNSVLNADLNKTIIVISQNPEEHEGICHICRGLMLSFRNPTHHQILNKYSREDALKLCAFIDNVLQLIAAAEVRTKS
jgi:hypothetical protein